MEDTMTVKTKKDVHRLSDMSVEEAYVIVCNDLKAIYNIKDV